MNNNAQNHLNEIVKKDKIFYLDLCNRNLAGEMDLKDFTNLKTLNASNNKFENLDFLNSLPNKDKLQSLNFFGNEIKEIDFTLLLENFPNLKMLNLDNNPLSLKDFNKLSSEQLNSLVNKIESKQIKINTWKGTLTLDLLKALQELKVKESSSNSNNNGSNSQFNQQDISADYKLTEKPNQGNNNLLLILIIVGSLLIGSLFTYLFLKSKQKSRKNH